MTAPPFSEFLAVRVAQLERERDQAKKRVRDLERSRDLWKHRALRKAGLRA